MDNIGSQLIKIVLIKATAILENCTERKFKLNIVKKLKKTNRQLGS